MDGIIAMVVLALAGAAVVFAVRAHKRRKVEVKARQDAWAGSGAQAEVKGDSADRDPK